MKTVICCIFYLCCFCIRGDTSAYFEKFYSVSRIEFNDKRIIGALMDYINEDDLNGVEGALVLKFDKSEPDLFYLGYIVYESGLFHDPPSFYSFINNKLVLVYTGIEPYLNYNNSSFKSLFKDAGRPFAIHGGVIVEPTYWKFTLNENGYIKEFINGLPY